MGFRTAFQTASTVSPSLSLVVFTRPDGGCKAVSLGQSLSSLSVLGSVVFRAAGPGEEEWQICILHSPKAGVWVLPKGRKDYREPLESAAIRETYEETGYKCELLPLPHVNMVDELCVLDGMAEPFAMTVRSLGKGTKMIWWCLTRTIDKVRRQRTFVRNLSQPVERGSHTKIAGKASVRLVQESHVEL